MDKQDNKKAATLTAVDLSKTLITASLIAFVADGAFLRFSQGSQGSLCTQLVLLGFLLTSMVLFILSCYMGGWGISKVFRNTNTNKSEPWEISLFSKYFDCQVILSLFGLICMGIALVVLFSTNLMEDQQKKGRTYRIESSLNHLQRTTNDLNRSLDEWESSLNELRSFLNESGKSESSPNDTNSTN